MSRLRTKRRLSWYHPSSLMRGALARPRLLLATGAALLAIFLLPQTLSPSFRAAAAWNIGALIYLVATFYLVCTETSAELRERAADEDESGVVFLALLLLAAAASFSAVIGLIGESRNMSGMLKSADLALAGLTIMTSWLVMQVIFTLHYAHAYYRPDHVGEQAGGLRFPEEEHPDYWDFFYFTTSIGAASQTSDISITSKRLRRLALAHSIISFVFNTTVVALAINLAAGLI
jgi:uncharacterized membrane protein